MKTKTKSIEQMNGHEMKIQTKALDYPFHKRKAQQITFVDPSQELHSQNQMVNHTNRHHRLCLKILGVVVLETIDLIGTDLLWVKIIMTLGPNLIDMTQTDN